MANELGKTNAAIVKALLEEGYNGQQISILFQVNSRAVSQIKNNEEYITVKPNHSHGIPQEIFDIPKIAFLNILGKDRIIELCKFHRRR